MQILNKLTIKHLLMNKKRTIVTIIGIVLSTALMVGIGLLVSSYLESMRIDVAKGNGTYHAMVEGVGSKDFSIIQNNVHLKDSYYFAPLGFSYIESTNEYKPYLYVVEGSSEFLDTLTLVEGRLPENSNEIVISEHINTDGEVGLKVGDTITLDIGTRLSEGEALDISHNYGIGTTWMDGIENVPKEELDVSMTKTYTIVGIVQRSFYEDYSAAGYMVFSLDTTKHSLYNIYLEYNKPSKTYEYTEEIVSGLGLEDHSYNYNEQLLYFYGASKYDNINNTYLPIILIALSVISIGCIIVIYNSFAISTMERKKSFGLYASVGATRKQILKTVLFEAFIVGFIGMVLGLAGAFLGIYIVILVLNHLLSSFIDIYFVFHVDLLYLMIPLIFMILVIFISAYLPARRSSKISPIVAIRGNDDIKISKKEIRTPKFICRIFGIEGDIAFKNIKRNKKKYRITVISLFISIVMFNTFTSYLGYITVSSDMVDYYDYDIEISSSGDLDVLQSDFDSVAKNYDIEDSMRIYAQEPIYISNLNSSDFTLEYQNAYLRDITYDDQLLFHLYVLDDEDYRGITDAESLLINSKYYTSYTDNNRKVYDIDIFNNQTYHLSFTFDENSYEINAEVSDKDIKGLKNILYYPMPVLVIPLSTYQNKLGYTGDYLSSLVMTTDQYREIKEDLDEDKHNLKLEYSVYSPAIEYANTRNMILAVKILFYGFIALVTLIGVTSVFNTISTNINLRRKEFAMLRSVGLSPRGFNKILFLESLFFGFKSLVYGIPVSIGINVLISLSLTNVFSTSIIIPWNSILISILGVFVIVLIAMWYSARRVKKENILEALREENI